MSLNTATHPRSLPTLDRLKAAIPANPDAKLIASQWFQSFASKLSAGDVRSVIATLLEDALWRDMLALTWDFLTFEGKDVIGSALHDVLPGLKLSGLRLNEESVVFSQPFPDLAWIQGMFDFETAAGIGSGIFRIVPTETSEWKGYNIYTNLEELKGFPERTGVHRDFVPNHGMWPEKRKKEMEFKDKEPTVVVIGGGHGGLDVAARLKLLGVSVLVLEKNERVGDQWRNRYEALCLHDPVCELI